MKYKDFLAWCNERSCDGCWGFTTAIKCIHVIEEVKKLPFWKREKVWQKINLENKIVEDFVKPTNIKIDELKNGQSKKSPRQRASAHVSPAGSVGASAKQRCPQDTRTPLDKGRLPVPTQLSDSEVVKILECFVNEECPDCERCSYYDYCRKNRVYIDVLDLVNRLQAENEKLKKENEILSENADTAFQDGLNEAQDLYSAEVKIKIKAETYKEFEEKLQEELRMYGEKDKFNKAVFLNIADKAKKEFMGAERTGTFPTINNELGEDNE